MCIAALVEQVPHLTHADSQARPSTPNAAPCQGKRNQFEPSEQRTVAPGRPYPTGDWQTAHVANLVSNLAPWGKWRPLFEDHAACVDLIDELPGRAIAAAA